MQTTSNIHCFGTKGLMGFVLYLCAGIFVSACSTIGTASLCDDRPAGPNCENAQDPQVALERFGCETPCPADKPICDHANAQCVACTNNAQCTTRSQSVCSPSGGCEPCTTLADCSHIPETLTCESGVCAQCTLAEESICEGTSCDLNAGACTETLLFMTPACGACRADNECAPGLLCVPMKFKGEDIEGGYCLAPSGGGCGDKPFSVETDQRVSLSGAGAQSYCGVAETATTCVAVRNLVDDDSSDPECTAADVADTCGIPGLDDSVCEEVNGTPNQCTYPCGSTMQCPTGFGCGDGFCD